MFEKQRQQMVQRFVLDSGIKDQKVIYAMERVQRHLFVEPALSHQAYEGRSLPIGFGQTISHPTTVALMTQILALKGSERVLEVGTGSGYQAAVLAEIGIKVFTIERIPKLARRAQNQFDQLGYYNIAVKIGDGSLGWNEHAPYDRIIVTAGAPDVPDTLTNQLAEEGYLVIPVGEKEYQKLKLIKRENGELKMCEKVWRTFVPLVGQKGFHL
jgi:protein-L-isoaspartate(D-aspartate) O-methyltransferase